MTLRDPMWEGRFDIIPFWRVGTFQCRASSYAQSEEFAGASFFEKIGKFDRFGYTKEKASLVWGEAFF